MRALLRNPELVRHVRAEMRPPRMLLSGGIAAVICFLVSVVHSQIMTNVPVGELNRPERSFFVWMAVLQGIVLVMWAFSASLQAIAGERQLKTYDFVRTTRMSSAELLVGYLFGAPIMAYFTIGVTAVFALVSGLGVGLPLRAMLATYTLILLFTIFVSLFGLMLSMLIEKPRAAGSLLVIWFLIWPFSVFGMGSVGSPFPGFSALALVPGLIHLFDPTSLARSTAPFFGAQVPLFLMSILLYVAFGSWIVLALVRNLKKEREEIQLLTRTEALIFTAFINVLFLGLFDKNFTDFDYTARPNSAFPIVAFFIIMNQGLFYIVGLATLAPAERLKIWYREWKAQRRSYLAESGLPWPWIVFAGGIAFVAMTLVDMSARTANQNTWPPRTILLAWLVVLAYAIRDILFLQWCMLTRMKNPLAKGVGLIWLYYFAALIASSVFAPGRSRSTTGLAYLTPFGGFIRETRTPDLWPGIMLQVLISGVIIFLIHQRLDQMQLKTSAATA